MPSYQVCYETFPYHYSVKWFDREKLGTKREETALCIEHTWSLFGEQMWKQSYDRK